MLKHVAGDVLHIKPRDCFRPPSQPRVLLLDELPARSKQRHPTRLPRLYLLLRTRESLFRLTRFPELGEDEGSLAV